MRGVDYEGPQRWVEIISRTCMQSMAWLSQDLLPQATVTQEMTPPVSFTS